MVRCETGLVLIQHAWGTETWQLSCCKDTRSQCPQMMDFSWPRNSCQHAQIDLSFKLVLLDQEKLLHLVTAVACLHRRRKNLAAVRVHILSISHCDPFTSDVSGNSSFDSSPAPITIILTMMSTEENVFYCHLAGIQDLCVWQKQKWEFGFELGGTAITNKNYLLQSVDNARQVL